jgi:hypothetical protein
MPENETQLSKNQPRTAWNKGKLVGAKPPLRPKHVWSIRTRLMVEGRTRDLALFNLAIDSKLRGCDVVALKVEDVAPGGDLLPDLPPFISRVCSGFGPGWGGLQTRSV